VNGQPAHAGKIVEAWKRQKKSAHSEEQAEVYIKREFIYSVLQNTCKIAEWFRFLSSS
jgi:hypothetical protein